MTTAPLAATQLGSLVERVVLKTPAHDIHTHLYAPAFGGLLRWGVDELLTYHSLVAEGFRHWDLPYEKYWELDRASQAELIWTTLFLQSSPVSEACRGVLTTLQALGAGVETRDLSAIRRWYASHHVEGLLLRVMDLAGVRTICMANSPFDDRERAVWERGGTQDRRFTSALRIDALLHDWPSAARRLGGWGYPLDADLTPASCAAVRRFLADWSRRIGPLYVATAMPPDFDYPAGTPMARMIDEVVLPHCAEHNQPLALIPGVRRAVNPALRQAGDIAERTDLAAYERLIAAHPRQKFMLTALARENHHELCLLARKFRNLHVFGCSWLAGVPSLVEETTRMRVELLGLSMTPHHSNARVLEQLVSRWSHARQVIADVLKSKYLALAAVGWTVTEAEVARDAEALFGGAFEAFLKRSL